jgi:hypothetical protein
MRWKGLGWIYLSLCRDSWRAVVNTVMNLVIPKMREVLELLKSCWSLEDSAARMLLLS